MKKLNKPALWRILEVRQTLNNWFYGIRKFSLFNIFIYSCCRGPFHWNQSLSLFSALGFFTPLPQGISSLQNSDK